MRQNRIHSSPNKDLTFGSGYYYLTGSICDEILDEYKQFVSKKFIYSNSYG